MRIPENETNANAGGFAGLRPKVLSGDDEVPHALELPLVILGHVAERAEREPSLNAERARRVGFGRAVVVLSDLRDRLVAAVIADQELIPSGRLPPVVGAHATEDGLLLADRPRSSGEGRHGDHLRFVDPNVRPGKRRARVK